MAALAALAQPTRLGIFRALVRRGSRGLPAGQIAERLGVAAPTLSFHLATLKDAGLVSCTRAGRSLIYTADCAAAKTLIDFLSANCFREAQRG